MLGIRSLAVVRAVRLPAHAPQVAAGCVQLLHHKLSSTSLGQVRAASHGRNPIQTTMSSNDRPVSTWVANTSEMADMLPETSELGDQKEVAARSHGLVHVHWKDLQELNPKAMEQLSKAFVGPEANGAIAVVGIPNYKEMKDKAYREGINLALLDDEGRKTAAAVSNTYPGWSGTPGGETHPLQSSFLFNVKEEIPGGKPDAYFGKNLFPNENFRNAFANLTTPMHDAALKVLYGCDVLLEDLCRRSGVSWSASGRNLHDLAARGPALAGRFICYDSGFTREDTLLENRDAVDKPNATLDAKKEPREVGHASDGLASMRTGTTRVKSTTSSATGKASTASNKEPREAGHAGDGLASMRTHTTPVKSTAISTGKVASAGHAADGLASMRTHTTPVRSTTFSTAGKAASAGHAADGLASMRTHTTPVKSTTFSAGKVSVSKKDSPEAGHAGDGLASMRTHNTPIKSTTFSTAEKEASADDVGDYWLPWHIDSNFITVLHREAYAYESDASLAPEPEGAGLFVMDNSGTVSKADASDEAMILQIGAFAQIYSGGYLTACRHAIMSPRPLGIARFNFCNFWYVPWSTLCDLPDGRTVQEAVNQGWHAMMDESYVDVTMKQSFAAFRKFMTAPEARLQFQDTQRMLELAELLPALPPPTAQAHTSDMSASSARELVIDVMTDVRCPFSFLSLLNLQKAVAAANMEDRVIYRYHPVFLNPNVTEEGESLDDYLLREYGYSREYAHSKDYPLRRQGLELGVELNPNRRVLNTLAAFCLLELAEEMGKQHTALLALSHRYFEAAADISKMDILCDVAEELGMDRDSTRKRLQCPELQSRVMAKYEQLVDKVGEVPAFVVRERASGSGVELTGNRSPEAWEEVLADVQQKGQFMGMTVPGTEGNMVRLPEASPFGPVSLAMSAQHGWTSSEWPYTDDDFKRFDESPDTVMYEAPRFVNHLDDLSLSRLTGAYRAFFMAAKPGFSVLDMCSSWVSHFPGELLDGARVVVHGLNQRELDANPQATEKHVQDLNSSPALPWEDGSFDFVTNALSVQYLTKPRAVFAEMHRVLKPGGVAIVAFSHRAFIEKAVRVWAEEPDDGEGHAHLICRYFQHSTPGGWKDISTIDVSPRSGDPMWLVSACRV